MNRVNYSSFINQLDNTPSDVVAVSGNGSSFNTLFKQYEKVILESLVTAFGLSDKLGGNVDTIHNVRNGVYATQEAYEEYQNRDDYSSNSYHSHGNYILTNKENKEQRIQGNLQDSYSNKNFDKADRVDLDHIISAKNIHDDPGRILAECNGEDLANMDSNLVPTSATVNRSKGKRDAKQFADDLDNTCVERQQNIQTLESKDSLTLSEQNKLRKLKELEEVDTDKLRELDKTARKEYDKTISLKYYTSGKFLKSTVLDAGLGGIKMGIKQTVGLFFIEFWLEIKERFPKIVNALKEDFSFSELFSQVGDMIRFAFNRAKSSFANVLQTFKEGAIVGFLSSISTTIINIFTTTAKNGIRLIRQLWSYIVKIVKILVVNPEGYTFGQKMKEIAKILVLGVSTVLGIIVEEAIAKIPFINSIPVLNEVVPVFCGTMVTGLLSITIMYFIDNSGVVSKTLSLFDRQFEIALENIKVINQQLDIYMAKLLDIDFQTLQNEISAINRLNQKLIATKDVAKFNDILYKECENRKIKLQFNSFDEFDRCMLDDSFVLEL